jgi:hypothetical protein
MKEIEPQAERLIVFYLRNIKLLVTTFMYFIKDKKEKGKFVHFFNQAPRHEDILGE